MRDVIMAERKWSLTWNGRVVGWIDDPSFDQPFYYGRWVPDQSPEAVTFLAALAEAVARDDGLDVLLDDKLQGQVMSLPDDHDGTMDVRWVLSESARPTPPAR
jgi:hypothetical protein